MYFFKLWMEYKLITLSSFGCVCCNYKNYMKKIGTHLKFKHKLQNSCIMRLNKLQDTKWGVLNNSHRKDESSVAVFDSYFLCIHWSFASSFWGFLDVRGSIWVPWYLALKSPLVFLPVISPGPDKLISRHRGCFSVELLPKKLKGDHWKLPIQL